MKRDVNRIRSEVYLTGRVRLFTKDEGNCKNSITVRLRTLCEETEEIREVKGVTLG